MADQRDAFGGGPRGDARIAARRSPSGRRIAVHFHGSGTARSRVLVVGCINGLRCAGERVPRALRVPAGRRGVLVDPLPAAGGRRPGPVAAAPGRRRAAPGGRGSAAAARRSSTAPGRAPSCARGARGEAAGRRYARVAGLPFSATPSRGLARLDPGGAARLAGDHGRAARGAARPAGGAAPRVRDPAPRGDALQDARARGVDARRRRSRRSAGRTGARARAAPTASARALMPHRQGAPAGALPVLARRGTARPRPLRHAGARPATTA